MYIKVNEINYNTIYTRVINGILHDEKLQSYSLDILRRTIDFFIGTEEYEKCEILKNIINKRLSNEN